MTCSGHLTNHPEGRRAGVVPGCKERAPSLSGHTRRQWAILKEKLLLGDIRRKGPTVGHLRSLLTCVHLFPVDTAWWRPDRGHVIDWCGPERGYAIVKGQGDE